MPAPSPPLPPLALTPACSRFSLCPQLPTKPTDALWAPACVAHTGNLNLLSPTKVAGVSYKDSVVSWSSGTGAVPRVLVDSCVGASCNPTCPSTPGVAEVARMRTEGCWSC
jgi:hypothetical protein